MSVQDPKKPDDPGQTSRAGESYWQQNLRLITIGLVIWFTVSFGFGLLLVEPLNEIRIGGYKLGFWFAQQGSIYTFVALIFWYGHKMNQLDKAHGVEEEDE